MPQFISDEHPYYQNFQRKQIVIWSVLLVIVLGVSGSLFYFSYYLFGGGENRAGVINQPTAKTPIAKCANCLSGGLAQAAQMGKEYIVYGKFFSEEKRYKIFKAYHDFFSQEEIFSFPWQDGDSLPSYDDCSLFVQEQSDWLTNSSPARLLPSRGSALCVRGLPSLADYPGNKIAVFTDFNNGFLIDHNGKVGGLAEFVPSYSDFTISPNGKKMFYFKHLSSFGTVALALRDLEKGMDVRVWPVSSAASEACDFVGWSEDSIIAYCAAKKNNGVELKAFNSGNHSYKNIALFDKAADVKYYPEQSLLIVAAENAIISFNTKTARKDALLTLPKTNIRNAFLLPDISKIIFTAFGSDGAYQGIYSSGVDGSGISKFSQQDGASLVSVSPDFKKALYKSQTDYFIVNTDGSGDIEFGINGDGAFDAQIVGWYK